MLKLGKLLLGSGNFLLDSGSELAQEKAFLIAQLKAAPNNKALKASVITAQGSHYSQGPHCAQGCYPQDDQRPLSAQGCHCAQDAQGCSG